MVDAERDVVGEGADGNVARAERHLGGSGGHERQRGAVKVQGVRELGVKKDIMCRSLEDATATAAAAAFSTTTYKIELQQKQQQQYKRQQKQQQQQQQQQQ